MAKLQKAVAGGPIVPSNYIDREKLAQAKAEIQQKRSSEMEDVMNLPDSPVANRKQPKPAQQIQSTDDMVQDIKKRQEKQRR